MPEYLFDNEAPQAGARFDALGALFDGVTAQHLGRIGVSEGWRCLEVGAGGGSITRWLAAQVGTSGHVLAIDLDVRWLAQSLREPNVELRQLDVVRDELPAAAFDLVHERLVLMHIPERQAVLERLVASLRPGGWLLAEDFDGTTAPDMFAAPESSDEEFGNVMAGAIRTLLTERGADVSYGYKLPRALRAAGLTDVRATAYRAVSDDAVRHLNRANVAQVGDQLVARANVTRADVDRFLTLLDDPAFDPTSPLLVSAWGRVPPSD